eukprot:738725-Amphidinium_carterae.1
MRWRIENGTYQGFSVFADSTLHKLLWNYVVTHLIDSRVLSGRGMTAVFMDDLLLLFIMDSAFAEGASPSDVAATVAEARAEMSRVFEESFGMKTDILKSLIGRRKRVFLNELLVGPCRVSDFFKYFCRPMLSREGCNSSPLDPFAKFDGIMSQSTEVNVPAWLAFGIYVRFAVRFARRAFSSLSSLQPEGLACSLVMENSLNGLGVVSPCPYLRFPIKDSALLLAAAVDQT